MFQWLTEHRDEASVTHDLSVGLRENYRQRWKTAINAVRASTKFKTFAAIAADERAANSSSPASSADSSSDKPDKSGMPTRKELLSDGSSEDEDGGYETGEEGNDEDAQLAKKTQEVAI